MIKSMDSLHVSAYWSDEYGFLVQVTDEKEHSIDELEGRVHLFGWHSNSFYGSAIERKEFNRDAYYVVPALLALDYFRSPKPLIHSEIRWSEEAQFWSRAAKVYYEALTSHAFKPDFEKWQLGKMKWTLALENFPELHTKWSSLIVDASKLALEKDLISWLDAMINDLIKTDEKVKSAWSVLLESYPVLQHKKLQDNITTPAFQDDWQIAIGLEQDDSPFRIGIQLVEPEQSDMHDDADAESKWSIHLILIDTEQPELRLSIKPDGTWLEEEPIPLHWEEVLDAQLEKQTLKWAQIVPELMTEDEPLELLSTLTEDEVWTFLTKYSTTLINAGTAVYLPSWWEPLKQKNQHIKAKLIPQSELVGTGHSMLSAEQLVKFDWRIALGTHEFSEQQFYELIEKNKKLFKLQGEWIYLDEVMTERIQQLIQEVKKKEGLSIRELIAMHAANTVKLPDSNEELEQTNDELYELELNTKWLELTNQLQHKDKIPNIEKPEDLTGELRNYQLAGVSWLLFLRHYSLGGCLADDMGLGKTIQWLAYLLHVKKHENPTEPSLLICPTSVLGNWQKEAERFAPDLKIHLHYGSNRAKDEDFTEVTRTADVVITSYTLAQIDQAELASRTWDSICLDEAQNIKNVYTKQARAIRKVDAKHRVAMTGTPMENRLTELWSIIDFINPGYLGTLTQFQQKFVTPIERRNHQGKIHILQHMIRPFLLRRLKKDPTILLDLPDKHEQKTFVSLSLEQATLYEQLIQQMFERIDRLSMMERRGLVLSNLIKLKQICNHPALFLQEPNQIDKFNIERSTKLVRLLEMVSQLREEGDACLIFTQFIHMGHLLQTTFERYLNEPTMFLHGGVPKAQRDEMIARFQSQDASEEPPCKIFILSLKAGGIGLNLTAANHVFHYDRWWNPAIENQATDRAFRIGQTQDVQVHKFVTLGTLEERIDEMIERKQGLNEQIVGSGENWITELSTDELKSMFSLRKEWIKTD